MELKTEMTINGFEDLDDAEGYIMDAVHSLDAPDEFQGKMVITIEYFPTQKELNPIVGLYKDEMRLDVQTNFVTQHGMGVFNTIPDTRTEEDV